MITFGILAQFAALAFTLLSMGLLLGGLGRNNLRLVQAGKRGLLSAAAATTLASIALGYLFLTDAFQVEYVASYSDRALPLFYKLTAFWAGQKGSLLFWAWVLSLFTALVIFNNRKERDDRSSPYVYLVLAATLGFFLFLLCVVSNPFDTLGFTPRDGNGLNPMLQNPGMVFHPPLLFFGYIGFTVPFAYAIAALITGNTDANWIRKTRAWNVLSWIFLSIGIILGGQWAYVELGWGGYWAWDPVENASFIPWLVSTAFIHTAIIQERRGIMKVWNMVLILLTFALCIFGTYLVRSGVLQSVHDFGATGLGGYFLCFVAVVLIGGFYLLAESYGEFKTPGSVESYLSRESTFLFNNVILLALAFATLLGTIFPILSEAVTGNKITVGQPFFNQVNTPLFLILVLLTGICPLIGWRKASAANLRRNFLRPSLTALLAGILMGVSGISEPYALLAFCLAAFVCATIIQEYVTAIRSRKKLTGESSASSALKLLWRMRRRYGGHIVHFGLAIMVIGIAASSAYKLENQGTLAKGESLAIGDFTLKYEDFRIYEKYNRTVYVARLGVFRDDTRIDVMEAERRNYINAKQPTTEVAIRSTLLEDLYVTMPGIGRNNEITLKVAVNPLLIWIWIGSGMMVLGGILAIIPSRRKET
ncbi:cytochrome C biogenesis protein [Geothermobacter hydrogeniphilus]|uniref:Cytochrome C biogenesis protein n=1 Tax=Geothermobacter hydrogeniphilus TaxID=1969733 RepID=A0A2K2HB65_9BACT|nr:heme lyase CcmF/NrfE family subunit [Geothermobacter hydrogeniphilus]PNU20479.1 cytochrome C biogenesis protein [Geothermobacter hydrogeniphilus]